MSSTEETNENCHKSAESVASLQHQDNNTTNLENTLDATSLRSLLTELKCLRDEVRFVKRKLCDQEKHIQGGIAATPPLLRYSSPGAQSPLCEEALDGDQFNNAALAIILHAKLAAEYQQENLEDNHIMFQRIKSDEHYITCANRPDNVANKDGTECSSHMNMFRKYLVLGADCSPAQGKQLHGLVNRMFTRRELTDSGDKVNLDPVRKEWTKFVAEVCFGKLMNPKIPRQTGVTNQDLLLRIEIIAEKIRELFFGTAETLNFVCLKADGTPRIIVLPTKEVLQAEIKLKLHDKESSEIRYIRNHLVAFDKYEASMERADRLHNIDPVHERSRPIIQAWRDNRKLKGHVVVHPSSVAQPKGHGKGKSKLFSYDCVSTPDSMKSTTRTSMGIAGHSAMFGSSSSSSSSSSSFAHSTSVFRPSYQQTSPAVAVLIEMEEVLLDRVGAADVEEYSIPRSAKSQKQKHISESKGLLDHYKSIYACSDNEDEKDADGEDESSPQDEEMETQREYELE